MDRVPITTDCPCSKLAQKGVSWPSQVPTLLQVPKPAHLPRKEWQGRPCLPRLRDSATWPGDPLDSHEGRSSPRTLAECPEWPFGRAPRRTVAVACVNPRSPAGAAVLGQSPQACSLGAPAKLAGAASRARGASRLSAPHPYREQQSVQQQQRQQQRARRPPPHGPARSARSIARSASARSRPLASLPRPPHGAARSSRPNPSRGSPAPAAAPPRPRERPRPLDEAPPSGQGPAPRDEAPPPGRGPAPDRPRVQGSSPLPAAQPNPAFVWAPRPPHYSERAAAQPGSPPNPAWSQGSDQGRRPAHGIALSPRAHLSPTPPPTLGPQIHPLSPSFTPRRRDSAHLPKRHALTPAPFLHRSHTLEPAWPPEVTCTLTTSRTNALSATVRERLLTLTCVTQLSGTNSPHPLKRSFSPLKRHTSTGDARDTTHTLSCSRSQSCFHTRTDVNPSIGS